MMNRGEALKILEDVRNNHKRLKECYGHDFSIDLNPEAKFRKNFRCTICGGIVDANTKYWYEQGLKHSGGV